MVKFDDAEFYYLDFETPLPNEAGGIPSGLYLAWAASAGLVPEALARDVRARRERGQTCADILFDVADGKLTSAEFDAQGLAFTEAYYKASYLGDYARCFGIADATNDALCKVPDTPASLARLSTLLDARLAAWRAAPRAAAKPMPQKPTHEGLLVEMRRDLVPLLAADGYHIVDAGNEFLILGRRHQGTIEQHLLYMVSTSGSSPSASMRVYLGAERVRRVWLRLPDPAHHAAPPPAFTVPVRREPDVQADGLSLMAVHEGYEQYFKRLPGDPNAWGRVAVMHYVEKVRPRMAALNTVTALAEQIGYAGQMIRLRNHLGHLKGPEVLARAVLLSAYGDRLRGAGGADLVKHLQQQIRFDIHRASDAFPTKADLDALIAALQQPGMIEQVRAYLDG